MNVDVPIASAPELADRAWPAGLRLPAWPGTLWIGLGIVVAWSLVSALLPLLLGRDAEEVVYGARLIAPSAAYPFGTDPVGRDVLVRTAVAFRYDFLVAFGSVVAAAI